MVHPQGTNWSLEMKIRYSEEAASEIEATAHWYEENRPGLGSEFIMSLEAVLASIRRTPQLYAKTHRSDVRRALIKRFPYGLFFREKEGWIEVVSVFHLRRNPNSLKQRL